MQDILLISAGHSALLAHIAAAQAAGHRILVVEDTATPETVSEQLRGLTQHVVHFDATTFHLDTAAIKKAFSVKRAERASTHSDWNHPYPPPRRQKRK